MIRQALRFIVVIALLLQLGCQTSQSANSETRKEPRLGNETKGVAAESVKLLPVDEGSQDSSFVAFRNRLLTAVKTHDVAFVLSSLDQNIVNGSDAEHGLREFKNQWQLDLGEERLWETLATILGMGGSFRVSEGHKEFCAPYVTSKWPTVVSQLPQGADPLDYQVIIDRDVALKAEPNSNAPTAATLTYDVVRVVPAPPKSGNSSSWMKIATLAGQEGFVSDKYIRSATDYHACFKRVGRKWLMTELAALE